VDVDATPLNDGLHRFRRRPDEAVMPVPEDDFTR
jgi:hypothetical protein